ncbi:MAG: hypothetical protein FWH02_01085 [Oscillospiraceae bacterium]|nr:hypothetical protein [Oscillospiraceae bacterium]
MHIRKDASMITFDIIKYFFLITTALICVLPFIMIVSGSFSSNTVIVREGYSIFPRDVTMQAYETIFNAPKGIMQAYRNNLYYVAIGTFTGLLTTTLTAYVISRKEFKYRNTVSFLIYFTTIFGGGMVP